MAVSIDFPDPNKYFKQLNPSQLLTFWVPMEMDCSETAEGHRSLNVIISECINMAGVSHSVLYRPKSLACRFVYFLSAPCIQKQSCTQQLPVFVPARDAVGRRRRIKIAAPSQWIQLHARLLRQEHKTDFHCISVSQLFLSTCSSSEWQEEMFSEVFVFSYWDWKRAKIWEKKQLLDWFLKGVGNWTGLRQLLEKNVLKIK